MIDSMTSNQNRLIIPLGFYSPSLGYPVDDGPRQNRLSLIGTPPLLFQWSQPSSCMCFCQGLGITTHLRRHPAKLMQRYIRAQSDASSAVGNSDGAQPNPTRYNAVNLIPIPTPKEPAWTTL